MYIHVTGTNLAGFRLGFHTQTVSVVRLIPIHLKETQKIKKKSRWSFTHIHIHKMSQLIPTDLAQLRDQQLFLTSFTHWSLSTKQILAALQSIS